MLDALAEIQNLITAKIKDATAYTASSLSKDEFERNQVWVSEGREL
jgi:hypothetical protein